MWEKLSLIIPVLNEEKNIYLLTKKIILNIKKIKYEIIFVDDNSTDNTKKKLRELKKKYRFFKPIFRNKRGLEGIKWATSKDYFETVGETKGWVAVPSGTRKSVEEDSRRIAAAPFAPAVVDAIMSVDPADATLLPTPYTGVQFVAIPEFQGIGNYVGQQVSAALAGNQSVEEALANSQKFATREMTKAGYLK